MADEIISMDHSSGQTLYAVVWYQGQYFDWTDNALETPSAGSDSQAVLSMTEYALDGNATSHYATAAVNLTTLWDYLSPRDFIVRIYAQQGGSPDLTNDPIIKSSVLRVRLGRNNPTIDITAISALHKDLGTPLGTFWMVVTADGEPVDMANTSEATDPTAVVTLRKEGASSDFVPASAATSPNAAGQYYVSFTDPNYDAERTYLGTVKIATDKLIRHIPFRAAG